MLHREYCFADLILTLKMKNRNWAVFILVYIALPQLLDTTAIFELNNNLIAQLVILFHIYNLHLRGNWFTTEFALSPTRCRLINHPILHQLLPSSNNIVNVLSPISSMWPRDHREPCSACRHPCSVTSWQHTPEVSFTVATYWRQYDACVRACVLNCVPCTMIRRENDGRWTTAGHHRLQATRTHGDLNWWWGVLRTDSSV